MLRYRYWLGGLLLAIASTAVAESKEKDATVWVAQMVQAVRTLAYEGTFVYLHDNQLESMRIVHTVENGREQEHLMSLNGAAREVIRRGDSVICVLPDTKAVSVSRRQTDRAFPAVLPINLNELSGYYEFLLMKDARIAGQLAKVVAVIPRDRYRYGYRIFLDAEHALPLKTDTLNSSGESIAQIMFTALRVDPLIQGIPSVSPNEYEDYAWVHPEPAQEMSITGHANWRFEPLPAGFKLKVRVQRKDSSGGAEVEHFVFSDGLATLSVYIEKAEDEDGLQAESHMGAVNAFGTRISGYQVTVVGEVPAQTVRYVANSIEYVAANGAGQ